VLARIENDIVSRDGQEYLKIKSLKSTSNQRESVFGYKIYSEETRLSVNNLPFAFKKIFNIIF
jgi:hypothetical protein